MLSLIYSSKILKSFIILQFYVTYDKCKLVLLDIVCKSKGILSY